jgi:hypothetical protein
MSDQKDHPLNRAINALYTAIYFADHLGDVNREVKNLFLLQDLIEQVRKGELDLSDFDSGGIDTAMLRDYNKVSTGGYLSYVSASEVDDDDDDEG